jgi:hypothetical protein
MPVTLTALPTTEHEAETPEPSVAVAVTVAIPTLRIVTKLFSTVATAALLVVQTTFWLVVFSGTKTGTSVAVSPAMPEKSPRDRERPDAITGLTITEQVSERFVPSVVEAVIVALPTERAVRLPCASTRTTEGLEEVQLTVVTATVEGRIVAASDAD